MRQPAGEPAVVLHGGPGSGCTSWQRRLFDPEAYRIVLFDQRNCGRSTPARERARRRPDDNTTPNLIADIERLREHLGVERWLVTGGSWGSALALAYAERHPDRVSEMVLWGVNAARRSEFDWLFRGGVGVFFPEQWERLCERGAGRAARHDVVDAYHGCCSTPTRRSRARAAYEWCLWESATPSWPPTSGLDDGSRTRRSRSRSRASSRTTCGTTPGSRTTCCSAGSTRTLRVRGARPGTLRLPGASRLRVGRAPRVAGLGARRRGRRRSRRGRAGNQEEIVRATDRFGVP